MKNGGDSRKTNLLLIVLAFSFFIVKGSAAYGDDEKPNHARVDADLTKEMDKLKEEIINAPLGNSSTPHDERIRELETEQKENRTKHLEQLQNDVKEKKEGSDKDLSEFASKNLSNFKDQMKELQEKKDRSPAEDEQLKNLEKVVKENTISGEEKKKVEDYKDTGFNKRGNIARSLKQIEKLNALEQKLEKEGKALSEDEYKARATLTKAVKEFVKKESAEQQYQQVREDFAKFIPSAKILKAPLATNQNVVNLTTSETRNPAGFAQAIQNSPANDLSEFNGRTIQSYGGSPLPKEVASAIQQGKNVGYVVDNATGSRIFYTNVGGTKTYIDSTPINAGAQRTNAGSPGTVQTQSTTVQYTSGRSPASVLPSYPYNPNVPSAGGRTSGAYNPPSGGCASGNCSGGGGSCYYINGQKICTGR